MNSHLRTWTRSLPITVLSFAAFGCDYSYDKEVEYEEKRLVLASEPCPSTQTVSGEQGDHAELTGYRLIQRKPLCWYRVDDLSPLPACGLPLDAPYVERERAAETPREPWRLTPVRLNELRTKMTDLVGPTDQTSYSADALESYEPVQSDVYCSSDHGAVLVMVATGNDCDDLDGQLLRLDRNGRSEAPSVVAHELLAQDDRAPTTVCHYDMTGERAERPFGCQGMSGPME